MNAVYDNDVPMKIFQIVVLPGDGIGPDVINESVAVLREVESRLSEVQFELTEHPAGAGEYLKNGDPLPQATLKACRECDAILLGAMGIPSVRWPTGTEMAPQIDIREELDVYAGVRPIQLYHPDHSPLKANRSNGIDFVIYRENTEGLFASRKEKYAPDAPEVRDTMLITRKGSERLFRAAFRHAQRRRKLVTLVDKANVLPTMAYFRSIFDQIAGEFPDVRTERVYVDAASLFLVQRPADFDIIVTENMFGDILSDLAAGLVGGMGMAPSGDIGDRHAVFQPSHGSAPDIAGKGIANPLATILSVAMMLEWLDHEETHKGAAMIRKAVEKVCANPANATRDIGGSLTTNDMGKLVIAAL
jgi:3-isopropylmalate dehydrogenase